MPELPEVETIKRQLDKIITKKKIKDVRVLYPKIIKGTRKEIFKKLLFGKEVKKVKRRAKLLIIEVNNDLSILIHLRMTGQILFKNQNEKFDQHTHVIIDFEDGKSLYYRDIRKFGSIKLIKSKEIFNHPEVKRLGVEPLEKSLNISKIKTLMNGKKAMVKSLLLRQDLISGLGNIYTDEILFEAGIFPKRSGDSLSDEDWQSILNAMKRILKKSIKEKGTTFRDYVGVDDGKGNYKSYLKVYQRAGKSCVNCTSHIKKIKVYGRGTYFCPFCQK